MSPINVRRAFVHDNVDMDAGRQSRLASRQWSGAQRRQSGRYDVAVRCVSDYVIERFYRDVRLFRIYEGTSQIQQLVIARNMIREARR